MTIIQDLERQNRRKATRQLAGSSALLCMMVVLAIAVSGTSKVVPNAADPRVEKLQAKNERQTQQLDRLRELFTYCRTSVRWDEQACGAPPPARNMYVAPRNTTPSDDDDDDGDRTIVVTQPSRGSQRPDPTINPNPPQDNQSTGRPGRSGDSNGGGHRKNGDRTTKSGRK